MTRQILLYPAFQNVAFAILKFLFATVLLLLTVCASDVSGQQRQVDILDASRIVGGTYEGEQVRRILGNVHIQHKDFEMYCDSAYQFVNKREIRAFGNIEIDTGEEKIWADSLTYYTDVDFSEFRGRVVMEADSSTTLFGNSVDYRFSNKIAHFIDEIRLEDRRGTLRADSGYYYREVDSVRFQGNVQLSDSLQYLEGDSLFSNRRKKYYELHSRVFGDDRENKSMLKGDYLEADSTGRRLIRGNAWLKNYEADSSATDSSQTDSTATQPDTTHIQARRILSQDVRTSVDTTAIVHAYENVQVWSPDFSAISDTAQYTDSTETFELWSNAKAWHKQVQLTGPYIEAKLENGSIDSLKSYPQPFSVQQDTAIDRLNQIKGDTLHADFTEGNLSQIYVFQNAQLLRFTKNKQDSSDGAIEISAPSIRIFFEKGELVKMLAKGSNSGSFLPENEKTAERKLDGFSWNPDLRPQEPAQPMKRRLPPIPIDIFFKLPRKYLIHLKNTDPDNPRLPENFENISPMNGVQQDSTTLDTTATPDSSAEN